MTVQKRDRSLVSTLLFCQIVGHRIESSDRMAQILALGDRYCWFGAILLLAATVKDCW